MRVPSDNPEHARSMMKETYDDEKKEHVIRPRYDYRHYRSVMF